MTASASPGGPLAGVVAEIARVYREHGHPDDWGVQVIYEGAMGAHLNAAAIAQAFTAHAGDATVTLARKSYDHLLRTRDRALSDAKWQREQVEHAHRWAQEAFAEQRRLSDRLNAVCYAAASLGVPIDAINAALNPEVTDD